MCKLLTQDAAIKYLREICGSMSARIFQDEVRSGRIPQKPFGKKSVRYRQEDLDKWCNITNVYSDCSNVAKSTTRISRSLRTDNELSFAKVLAAKMKTTPKYGVRTESGK